MQLVEHLDIGRGELLGWTVPSVGQGANGPRVLKEGGKVGHEDDQQHEGEHDPGSLGGSLPTPSPSFWRHGRGSRKGLVAWTLMHSHRSAPPFASLRLERGR